jgi:hypothetical protein
MGRPPVARIATRLSSRPRPAHGLADLKPSGAVASGSLAGVDARSAGSSFGLGQREIERHVLRAAVLYIAEGKSMPRSMRLEDRQ